MFPFQLIQLRTLLRGTTEDDRRRQKKAKFMRGEWILSVARPFGLNSSLGW
jgi:hypothetical protein